MKKTKIKFEDIKAGDLLEIVDNIHGIKIVEAGVAFEKQTIMSGFTDWLTSQGGLLISDSTFTGSLFRVDVSEVKFEDIQTGDRIRVTEKIGTTVRTDEDTVVLKTGGMNMYWLNSAGAVVLFELVAPDVERTIEILEREGE